MKSKQNRQEPAIARIQPHTHTHTLYRMHGQINTLQRSISINFSLRSFVLRILLCIILIFTVILINQYAAHQMTVSNVICCNYFHQNVDVIYVIIHLQRDLK